MAIDRKFQQLDSRGNRLESESIRVQREIYQNTLNELEETLSMFYGRFAADGVLDPMEINRFNRLENLRNNITELIGDMNTPISGEMRRYLTETYEDNYYRTGFILETEGQIRLGFSLLDSRSVRELTIDRDINGLTLAQRLRINNEALARRVLNEFGTSIALGEGNRRAVSRLGNVLERDVNRIRTTVRTERTRITQQATLDSMRQSESRGLRLRKVWVSTIDERTRRSHRDLDGDRVGIDEEFTIRGRSALAPGGFGIGEEDINCRCRIITEIEGYPTENLERRARQALGEPVENRVIPYSTFNEYNDWFRNRVVESN